MRRSIEPIPDAFLPEVYQGDEEIDRNGGVKGIHGGKLLEDSVLQVGGEIGNDSNDDQDTENAIGMKSYLTASEQSGTNQ